MSQKVIGLWSGHDCSFCVLKDGVPELHTELERHLREKEPAGDSIELFYQHYGDTADVVALATCHRDSGIKAYRGSWERISQLNVPLHVCGHHQAHASNAFYSSNFQHATVITIDGGGIEDETNFTTGVTTWKGSGLDLEATNYLALDNMNIGGVWSRATRCVFRYETGWPQGNQCGTVMALAAMAKNPWRYIDSFRDAFGKDLKQAVARAPGHVVGRSVKDPMEQPHPYWRGLQEVADHDEENRYNIAGSLQLVTEEIIRSIIAQALALNPGSKHLCIAGGVALNSVAMGKIMGWFPELEGVYIPPVPYDAGLTIGAAQHYWHHVLRNPRIQWEDNTKAYLGKRYDRDEVEAALGRVSSQVTLENADDERVLDLLAQGKVVSVFNGRAESGRRALGNRSILADPRNAGAKDTINEKVKHRQGFRPFAPSIPRERVKDWFKVDVASPYMNFVLEFKDEVKHLVPAVVHFDGTGRLQTVTENDNVWYHGFLTKWQQKSGVPILLNTSFNDREPVVETPQHAINCFLKTQIDHLYFVEHSILVTRKETNHE